VSGANRFVTYRPGYVTRHAPLDCLGWHTGRARVQILGCGIERPTWLKRGDGPLQYSRVRQPSLGWTELPAAETACSPLNEAKGAEAHSHSQVVGALWLAPYSRTSPQHTHYIFRVLWRPFFPGFVASILPWPSDGPTKWREVDCCPVNRRRVQSRGKFTAVPCREWGYDFPDLHPPGGVLCVPSGEEPG